MELQLIDQIESLPPLPKTLLKIVEFETNNQLQPETLLAIIEKDPLVVSTLLKAANSSLFGFRGSVETPSRAINLLGINFSLAVIMSSILNNLVKTDLSPYGLTDDAFIHNSQLQFTLAQVWADEISVELKEDLQLPALLQEIGKFIISSILLKEDRAKEFNDLLNLYNCDFKAEKELVGYSTSEVTAMIFKHWRLNDDLSRIIEHIDYPEANDSVKTAYLHVIKIACNLIDPLSEKSLETARKEVEKYKLDRELFEKAIQKLREKLENN